MKQIIIFVVIFCCSFMSKAQVDFKDSLGVVTIKQDNRIEILGQKMAEYNLNLATKPRMSKGFRLMLLSTSNRDLAM